MQRRRTILWAALALVAVDLVFFSGASNYLASPQSRILDQLLILGANVALVVAAWRGRADLRSPLLLPGLAFIAATALAAAFSQRPAASVEALAVLLLAAPSYLVVRAILAEPWLRSRLDWLLIASTFAFVIAYLVQALTYWISWWSVAGPSVPPLRPGDAGLTVGTVNSIALYLELLVPVAVWLAWTRWRAMRFTWAFAILALGALVITGSRGAWLGAVAGGAVLAVLVWLGRGRPRPHLRTLGRGRASVVVGFVGVALVGIVIFGPLLLARLAGGDAGRFELWNAAWSMFTSSPLVGVGPGAWQGLRALTPISESVLAVLYTCHDSVLHILAETGILGLGASLWLVGAVARLGWRAIRSAPTPAERTLRAVSLATLVAFVVHSLVDSQTHIPAVAIMVFLLVARLDPAPAAAAPIGVSGGAAAPRRRSRLAVLAAVPVLVGAVALVPIDVAMVRAELGNGLLDRGDTAGAFAQFDAAVAIHDLPAYRLGQAIARAGVGDASGALGALAAQDRAEPFTFVASARATLLAAAGDSAGAEPLLQRVEAAGPYDPTATLQAAIVRARTGDATAAATDLAAAMSIVPSLIHSTPPAGLFDAATWASAQRQALATIGATAPTVAAAEAILAHLPDIAATASADPIVTAPERELLGILTAIVDTGSGDLDRARAILRQESSSYTVQALVWTIGFAAKSQRDIDDVGKLSVVEFFGYPQPPMEIVLDGRVSADYSLRLPRWPNAAESRLGPDRPYLPGMATIEPFYRPKP